MTKTTTRVLAGVAVAALAAAGVAAVVRYRQGRRLILMNAPISMSWRRGCATSKNRTRTSRQPPSVGSCKTFTGIGVFRWHGYDRG